MYLGLSGLHNRMRIRESFRDDVTMNPVGYHGAFNALTGETLQASQPVMATCGLRDERVSIDENHGRPPYRTSGPLLLYRLLHPTYIAGSARIKGRKLPVGFSLAGAGGSSRTVKTGEHWVLTYQGGFTKSLSGYPDALGAAESYRPTSFDSRNTDLDPDDLSDLGNRAYGLLRPKIEKASLTQSLAEIGSVRPMLKTSLKGFHELWGAILGASGRGRPSSSSRHRPGSNAWRMAPKAAGDQFLNVQFGWAPALQDLAHVISTVSDIESAVADATGNNDQWISRRFHEDVIESEDVVASTTGVTSSQCDPPLNTSWIVQPFSGSTVVTLRQVTRIWYEGSFKRYRPEFDPSRLRGHPALKAAEQSAALLGLRVNPTTLYRCIPWTWLADYAGSFTSGLQRLEDQLSGEMVSRRFHLMRTTFKRYEYRVRFSTFDGQAHDITWYKEASVKRRVNGQSSFGFSASPGGLTGMQYAILGALGTKAL